MDKKKMYDVEIIAQDGEHLYFRVGGEYYRIRWDESSKRLARASQLERGYFEISPSGYGIYWPLIDEDLAVGPLMRQGEKIGLDTAEVVRRRFASERILV